MGKNYSNDPRELAVQLLYEINNEDAFTNLALSQAFKNTEIARQDRALATTLVYGTEKNLTKLDLIIGMMSKTKLNKISPWIKEILRTGIYQIFYLDKVPSFAVVNECVNLSKKYSRDKASGFVNAILRNIIRQKEKIEIRIMDELEPFERLSVPKWLFRYIEKQYGSESACSFFEESLHNSPLTARVNTTLMDIDSLLAVLEAEGLSVEANKIFKDSVRFYGFPGVFDLKSHSQGLFMLQDEGAMVAVEALGINAGDVILDMCAAPGGKTAHMAEILNGSGKIISRDIYGHKIKLIEENVSRLKLKNVYTELKDSTIFYKEDQEKFDKVLLDAPCSGLGILRRKPDIKWKLDYEKILELIQVQKKMILHAFDSLKQGGVLVYCTCTINKHENYDIIEYLIKERKDAEVDHHYLGQLHPDLADQRGVIQLMPNIHGTDGFFISRIIKK
ncbi:MAG: 16S rRNA (cytosine(967)-C(5))-methyltransferase RsmB [Eubacteriaceae bacterium]|nr:16S rRNA (cytosine(967)-C(5))-methyltransferase RsmB [Eubacteriaceae bacterium]